MKTTLWLLKTIIVLIFGYIGTRLLMPSIATEPEIILGYGVFSCFLYMAINDLEDL